MRWYFLLVALTLISSFVQFEWRDENHPTETACNSIASAFWVDLYDGEVEEEEEVDSVQYQNKNDMVAELLSTNIM